MKVATQGLIQELRDACRQTLHNGNDLGLRSYSPREEPDRKESNVSFPSKRRRKLEIIRSRTWENILSDIIPILPSLTEQEHGQVLRYASIMLLGFVLPLSTGNEYFLLQHLSNRASDHQAGGASTSETAESPADVTEIVMSLSLEERMQSTPFRYASSEFGEIQAITDDHVDAAFCSFLQNVIGPLLRGRPAHTHQVDLLHVIAMAIHPQPSEQPIRSITKGLEANKSRHWQKAKRLINSEVPASFQVQYRHRLKLVQLIADNLLLPEEKGGEELFAGPLFDGALHHLRASLYAFGMSALHARDNHWSECALVSLAVQRGSPEIVRDEWGRLLNRLMDDDSDFQACHMTSSETPTASFMMKSNSPFSLHRARGHLLQQFLTRYSQARFYANAEFLQHALASLSDAIEYKVDNWTLEAHETSEPPTETAAPADSSKPPQDNPTSPQGGSEKKYDDVEMKDIDTSPKDESDGRIEAADDSGRTAESPGVLSSLLFAVKHIFYFLLNTPVASNEPEGDETEDNERRDMLISCGIQLLHHWNPDVAHEAARMLVPAFAYGPDNMLSDYAGAIFESTKLSVQKVLKSGSLMPITPIESMLAILSGKSVTFGESVLSMLISEIESCTTTTVYFRLLSQVTTACPLAAKRQEAKLSELLTETHDGNHKSHLLVALMSRRRTHFFKSQDTVLSNSIKKNISSDISGWDLYKLGRFAMVSGNFDIAQHIYSELSLQVDTEGSLLWLSTVQLIAEAEEALLNHGGKSIPNSTTLLRSAVSTLLMIPSTDDDCGFTFQCRLSNLRVDSLDLLCSIRQITAEMRFTNRGPKKFTRSSLHLRNSVKLLELVGSQYLTLYREWGLFLCQHSRTCLRTLHSLCRFVSSAARSTFIDDIPASSTEAFQRNAIRALSLPKGDAYHPLTVLMKHLDKTVLKNVKSSVDAKVRAAVMLQVIDGVLKVPCPFPRSFMSPQCLPKASLQVSLDPGILEYSVDGYEVQDDDIHVTTGALVSFRAHGYVPNELIQKASLPFHVILLWHRIVRCESSGGTISDLSQQATEEQAASNSGQKSQTFQAFQKAEDPLPLEASFPPSGVFHFDVGCDKLADAGLYLIETRLGCRDIRGGQWELATSGGSSSISVRISKSS